jgi:hypothetical protein
VFEQTNADAGRGRTASGEQIIPAPIRYGIEIAAIGARELAIARQLFLADANEWGADRIQAARLEHAIARATLDAWLHGIGSGEAVGSAYVAVAHRIVHEQRERLRLEPLE